MKKLSALLLALVLTVVSCACFAEETPSVSDKDAIETALNLKVFRENQEALESLFNK